MSGSFRGLAAYQRARALARDMYAATAAWPWFDRRTLGIQLVKSADSIAANIAEGTGRWHEKDKRRLFVTARGSLRETEHWILCAEERGLLPDGTSKRIDDISRPLNGLIKAKLED
jgi:four helix bundle protein